MHWECDIVEADYVVGPFTKFEGQVVGPDLSCLVDCFPEESDPGYSITSLLKDVIARGICTLSVFPAHSDSGGSSLHLPM